MCSYSHCLLVVSPTAVPMDRETREIDASGPAGASREHDTHQLHAMALGLVGQTIERAGGYRKDACRPRRCQDRSVCMWITLSGAA
jgi:hypothetical protein